MTELSPLPQELARLTPDGQVAIAMTGRAFDEAQQAGVLAITPLIENMRDIARGVELIEVEQPLPPTVLFVRSTSEGGKYIGHWDDRWPAHAGQPQTGMYFSAASIGEKPASYGSMVDIMGYAKAIGARAITEVSIPSWKPGASFIQAVGDGFALRQRAVQPPPAPSLLSRAVTLFPENNKERQGLKNARKLGDIALGEPFAITYSQNQPELK